MAKTVKIKDLPELGLDEPNVLHVQESYLRQVAHGKPLTAKKKSKSDVRATSAKWFRQKGTGRARQGERTNPHLYGGGLAFPPTPRRPRKGLNKQVRQSAMRSAVLMHVLNESAFVIQGKDFDDFAKTREVAEVLDKVPGTVCLVLRKDAPVWRSSRNLPLVRTISAEHVNVRDLMDNESLVFAQSALDEFRGIMKLHLVEPATEEAAEPVAAGDGGEE